MSYIFECLRWILARLKFVKEWSPHDLFDNTYFWYSWSPHFEFHGTSDQQIMLPFVGIIYQNLGDDNIKQITVDAVGNVREWTDKQFRSY